MKKNVLFMVLFVGLMFFACGQNGVDSSLNGTWVELRDEPGMVDLDFGRNRPVWNFNNGNFGLSIDDRKQIIKGTYKTSERKIIITPTHLYGDALNLDTLGKEFMLESKWYSRNELNSLYVPSKMTEEEFDEFSFELFSIRTANYSKTNNILTLTFLDESFDEEMPGGRFIKK